VLETVRHYTAMKMPYTGIGRECNVSHRRTTSPQWKIVTTSGDFPT